MIVRVHRYCLLLLALIGSLYTYAYDFEVDGIYYNLLLGNRVEVSFGNGHKYSGVVIIPEKIRFNGREYTVTSIGNSAFYSCDGLTSITIPNSVTSFGNSAFSGCSGLISITIPNSVTSIGNSAFASCTNLTQIEVERDNKKYDSRDGCSAVVETSSNTLVLGCKSTTIPSSVTSIGDYAFSEITTLTSIEIPNSVTFIGKSAFSGCSALTSIEIPNSVTSIGDNAFAHCSTLTSIEIPNSVTSIGNSAFSGCSGLTKINLPGSVTSIGTYAFSGCTNLTQIEVERNNKKYDSRDGCNAVIETSSNTLVIGCKNSTIPSSVTSIGASAFQNCTSLTKINLPSSVTFIGKSAFSECTSLTSITIPSSVSSIEEHAFYNCRSLTSITLPNSVTSIGDYAFADCSTLTSIEIPNSVTSIGNSAFYSCDGLTSIEIPNSVTSIGNSAFYSCDGLTSITLPNSVTSIGSSAFGSCRTLTSITLPNSVTSIGSSAFEYCSALTSIEIPNSVTSIGASAFRNCTSLTKINLPGFVSSIGNYVFSGCRTLTSITLPNSLKSIGSSAFEYCRALTSITLPNSLKSIGSTAFYYCYGLTSITLPNSVTSIGASAFAECKNLNEVRTLITSPFDISSSVFSSIAENAILFVPYGTMNEYSKHGWGVRFKKIVESAPITYTLSITSFGGGSVSYHSTIIRNQTTSFPVEQNSSATIELIPDDGFEINSVKVNDVDITSDVSNGKYTISNIIENIALSVVFEAIPPTTYTLSITASGNGSAAYGGTTIRSNTSSFTVNEGDYATVTFNPDSGYRIASVKVNDIDVTLNVSDNRYTIINITANTTLSVVFEAIPPTMYTLTITASGNGDVQYGSTTVRNQTSAVEVEEGSSGTVTFSPDGGNRIATVTVNGQDVTASIENYRYTIANISGDVTIVAAFEEIISVVAYDGVNYTVVSQDEGTVKVAEGNYGQVLTVPASFTAVDRTWQVTGIETDALKDNVGLAAVIWEPEVAFTATVSNPNLLLYVKSESYAPRAIHNVVVNGTAADITLVEAVDGNDFYCPQTFTAQHISFTHNYQMQTGLGESKGWETIALPFDVQTITHETKGTIVPFANWKNGDTSKPFWLMELTGTGFVEAGSIKAYTPYIISMPNHPQYDSQWLLNGKVTFAASSVTVGKTEDMNQSVFNGRTFIPCFAGKKVDEGFYALNVNNDWETNNSGMTEGSMFVWRLRNVHPFEAYLTSSSSAPRYAIGVFEDMTTGIKQMVDGRWMIEDAVYDLQGRKVESPSKKGVYIMNGKKKVVK